MRIAALSDFHIGARAGMDEFRHDERAFLERLARVVDTHDRTILVGDIWQTDHDWRFGQVAAARQLMVVVATDYSTMMNERDDHSDDGLEDGDGLSYISDGLQC